MKRRGFIYWLFLITGTFGAYAQYQNLKFENYSTLEGLSSSTCLEVFQDSEGFLWFGTIDGLNKYNGYDFEVYRAIPGDKNSISNNRINSITEDKFGNLWVGTSNGLNFFSKETRRFFHIQLNKNAPDFGEARDVINTVYYQASENRLWIGSKNGVSKADLDEKLLNNPLDLEFTNYTSINSNLDDNDVTSIIEDDQNQIWVFTEGDCINKFDPDSENFACKGSEINQSYKLDHLPKSTLIDTRGDFWIGNNLSKMIVWSSDKETFRTISPTQENIPVFDIYQDRNENVWISTDGYGIYILNLEGDIIQHIKHKREDPFSLPNNQPSKVLQGEEGVFWIATYNKGVVKLVLTKSSFGHYFYQGGSKYGLSTNIAQSVLQDTKGRIWIGTDGGGLNLFNEDEQTFTHYKYDPSNSSTISSNKILYLDEGSDGSIWVSTWDGGLNKFDPKTGLAIRYKHDPSDPGSIGQNTVWCAVEDDYNRVWAGTQTSGLNVLDLTTNKFSEFISDPFDSTSLTSDFVFSLFIDSKERLFIGTALGLCYLDLNKTGRGVPSKLEFSEVKVPGIQRIRVNYITEDNSGEIWVGTDQGLFRLSSDLKLQRFYSTLDGMPNNLILGVQEDSEHNIWVSTKSGLSRLDPDTDQFKNFNTHDGLQGLEFQSKSITRTSDGRIIAGGINGFNIFDPRDINNGEQKVKPVITSLKIFNKEVKVGEVINDRILLDQPLAYSPKLVLDYDEGYITFEFVALHYQNPERVQYAYKMAGLDEEFIDAGTGRQANYTSLLPGDYTFEVKANLGSEWPDSETAKIYIKVLPAPWNTWWAYTMYGMVFAGLLWGGMWYYTRRVKEDKEHELDQLKLRFFINLSHEFRTPLTLILNPVDKILSTPDDTEEVRSSALIIQRSSRKLLNLINQLLDFRKMDLGKQPLTLVKGDIIKFSNDIFQLFKDFAVAKDIKLSFESSYNELIAHFDPDKLEKIINNLLSNAIKFTEAGGEITLSISKLSGYAPGKLSFLNRNSKIDYVEIKVRDTGIGFKKEQLKDVFTRFFHADDTKTGTGIGLNFTKGLVEMHGGEILVESEYTKGSVFIVRLPQEGRGLSEEPKELDITRYHYDHDSMMSTGYDVAISDLGQSENEEAFDDNKEKWPLVLIIEDNKELRSHLKKELSNRFRVKEAVNGKDGLAKVNKFYPDIIISDVMMPEMDGFELCRQIKTNIDTSHIPVILLTARSLEEDRIEGYDTGADEYLPKPFNLGVLRARIKNLLEAKARLRERFASMAGVMPSSEVTSNTLDEVFLDKATKIILENVSDQEFGLDNILKEMGVSRSQFYRKINSLTGQNPSHFIRTIRLKYASELLTKDKYSVKEIAYMSGFNSSAYFTKTFREHFGKAPNQYLSELKETSDRP